MTDLKNLLNDPTRDQLAADLTQLVDTTLSSQSGLIGMMLKPAIAAAKKADPDAIAKGVNQFLPQIVGELQPYYDAYENDNAATFGAYLSTHEKDVVEKILATADQYKDQMPGPAQKAYSGFRGKAAGIIGPVLPELGEIIERHTK